MSARLNRRAFITLLGGAAAWPLAAMPHGARAQQAMPVIGFLSSRSPGESASVEAAFRQGLKETGYAEGQNVHIAFRWAESRYERLPALATDLVGIQPAVIVAVAGGGPVLATRSATRTIPTVFLMGDLDPVEAGLVRSVNRPGGNITGVILLTSLLGAKRLELLRELLPDAGEIGMLVNPNSADIERQTSDAQAAARTFGQRMHIANVNTGRDLDTAFATFVQHGTRAILVANDPFFLGQREHLVALAARHAIPTVYSYREYVATGGLMSYAPSLAEGYRLAGVYAGRVLRGEKPAELPVMQPTKFELVVNLRTAKALGIEMPPSLLARADEVIE
jgi:putative ABC transport system substrate-binding protein